MNNKVNKLNLLLRNLDDFEKSFVNLVNISLEVNNINVLGTMREYPFNKSINNIDISTWISKFRENIKQEIFKEMQANDELLEVKEMEKRLKCCHTTLSNFISNHINEYIGIPFFKVKADNSNANKYLYTKDFCHFLEECKNVDKKKR